MGTKHMWGFSSSHDLWLSSRDICFEGRALEHAFAASPGRRIRMRDDSTGVWQWVGGDELSLSLVVAPVVAEAPAIWPASTVSARGRKGEPLLIATASTSSRGAFSARPSAYSRGRAAGTPHEASRAAS